jgi:hypothetical protein
MELGLVLNFSASNLKIQNFENIQIVYIQYAKINI